MAKLADYIACSLIYHKGNKFEIDEERTIMPCIYEDSDEYIKEYWGDKGAAPPRGVRPSPRLTDKRLWQSIS